jgi:diguanylate cyclase (GGDEF)-like protein
MKHRVAKLKKNTIANRLFLPMVMLVGIYALVFWGIVWYGGVFDQLKNSEVDRVRQSVTQKATVIQDNLDTHWMKEENYMRLLQICKSMKGAVDSGAQGAMAVNDEIANEIGKMTENQGVRGAYVFFDNGSAYYVRRNDENQLVAEFGEEIYLATRGIGKSPTWQQGTGGNMTLCPAYNQLVEAKNSKPGLAEMDYACFSTNYQCGGKGERLLTFSIPLLDGAGNIYAVAGIEVSSDSLKVLIPDNDIRGTYMLGMVDTEKSFIERIVSQGELFESVLEQENGLWLIDNNKDGIYELGTEGERNAPDVITQEIRFYPESSAFSHQSWVLCAIVDDNEFAESVDKMKNSIITALLCASLVGILGLFFLSRILTKPIATLVSNLNVLNPRKPVQLPKVNIYEVDRLSSAIERVSKEVEMYALRVSEILRIAEIPVGVAEIDESTKEVYCTAQMFKLLGEVGESQDYKVISIAEFKKIIDKFKRGTVIFEEGEKHSEMTFCDNNTYKVYSGAKDAEWISFQTRETNGRLIVVVMDVTDKIKEKLKLEYERDFDELSRLLNKQAFARETKKRLSLETKPVGVMIMWDLDNLKYINDTYGHEYGDIYIREAAKIFAYLEQHNGLVARRSGDEFFAYVSGESEEELRELIHGIHGMLGDVVIKLPGDKEMKVRASAGLVWYPKDGSEYDDLIKKADFTMYDVKRSNKGSMQEFNRKTYEQDAVLLSGKEEMNEFLEKHLLKVAYQPIVDTVTGEIYGYEALMRPQTDTLHSPQDVIRIAKAQGKLTNLEKMLWEETIKDYFSKQKNGNQKLFVNSFAGILLEEKEQEKLREYSKGRGAQIVVELMEAQRVMLENVRRKKEYASGAGCQIALSDFGTGYNTEEKRLLEQVSYVKLGRELFEGIETDEERRKSVLHKVQGWHSQNLMVIALGVETEGELRFMQKCGVEFVQGFYLAKPSFEFVEDIKEIKEKIMV